jgi:signal transduction histidine kinase
VVEVAAYRIASEAMANAARHAQARRCDVEVSVKAGELRLVVEDDGAGLPEVVSEGVGLRSMKERAESVGGTWTLERRGPCTRVEARLPLQPGRVT